MLCLPGPAPLPSRLFHPPRRCLASCSAAPVSVFAFGNVKYLDPTRFPFRIDRRIAHRDEIHGCKFALLGALPARVNTWTLEPELDVRLVSTIALTLFFQTCSLFQLL
jgi:hypothetical protein